MHLFIERGPQGIARLHKRLASLLQLLVCLQELREQSADSWG